MAKTNMTAKEGKRSGGAGRVIGHVFAVIGVTLLALIVACAGALYVCLRGPSPTVKRLLTHSLHETSALYWIPGLYLSQEELDGYLASREITQDAVTNTELIHITAGTVSQGQPENTDDASGSPETAAPETNPDEDGDGIIVEEVSGPNYRGYMMLVLDPARVTLGKPDEYGGYGLDLWEMVEKYHAAAAINAGGFEDPDGTGTGGIPDGIVISDGELVWGDEGSTYGLVGFDKDHRLIVGTMTGAEALDMNMDCCCMFGPALVVNGVAQNEDGPLASGVNPRTAIGQRSDGVVLLLVIDGRQVSSVGATYDDLIDIMMEYGAVNACNLDGGSSSMMIYNGELLNTCASVFGPRDLPTAFVVLPQ